jgi:hypothetical protein
MTGPGAVAGRTLLAGLLGARRVRRRSDVGAPVGARVAGAVLALAVPGGAAALTRATFIAPASPAGRGLLVGHVFSGALLEELLWRAPLTDDRHRIRRAALSMTGFVALHVRRDGAASAPIHVVLAGAWTASALLGRTIRWTCLSHAAYNYLALTGRPR